MRAHIILIQIQFETNDLPMMEFSFNFLGSFVRFDLHGPDVLPKETAHEMGQIRVHKTTRDNLPTAIPRLATAEI
jgi:hypothetical protein